MLREGLRLVEEREAKLARLRETLEASIARGGNVSNDELRAAIETRVAELKAKRAK
ncbi:type II toxin-antitoxin system ParD family antitoxin [Rhizobium sp. WYJ-E13]|uniref:type II toxin-antitoxin system ParD family antitoxin n=1 Tax=Rhizobium sp. WYJ-E13 TaxID=2849093 RepID=UPI003467653E